MALSSHWLSLDLAGPGPAGPPCLPACLPACLPGLAAAFWDSFGYLVFPQLFDSAEVDWITAEFEGVVESDAATAGKDRPSHDGSSRTMIVPTIDHSPRLSTLLDDRRIVGICSDLLGEDFCYASGDGNYYSGDTGWQYVPR